MVTCLFLEGRGEHNPPPRKNPTKQKNNQINNSKRALKNKKKKPQTYSWGEGRVSNSNM